MKNLIKLFTLLVISSYNINAQDSANTCNELLPSEKESCSLTIEMINLDSDEGQIMIAVYSSKESWLNNPYKSQLISIQNGKATVTFDDLPFGIYAASAVHDIDKNGKMKTGIFGIPSEPYASSRGAKGKFGPPKWNDAEFSLQTNLTKEIIKF